MLFFIWCKTKLIQYILNKEGVNAITSNNGEMAIEYCVYNKTIDLVLMDIRMPGMNGIEAARLIRNLPNGNTMQIVAQTAIDISNSEKELYKDLFNGFIVKPTEINNLIGMVSNFFN
ncbi:MAG: hybrid sensor histidine kinase/response regulator [Ignavibacteria bacterium]|nr:hybrid sensor histidine kinase/response regulator [Ignavibacteria bacterium]